MKEQVAAHIGRRNRATTVSDLMPRFRGHTRSQVVAALRTAKSDGLIELVQAGDTSSEAVYGPLADNQEPAHLARAIGVWLPSITSETPMPAEDRQAFGEIMRNCQSFLRKQVSSAARPAR